MAGKVTFERLDEKGFHFSLEDGTKLTVTDYRDGIATINFENLLTSADYTRDLNDLMKGMFNFSGLRAICANVNEEERNKMRVNNFLRDYDQGKVSIMYKRFEFKSEEARKEWKKLTTENKDSGFRMLYGFVKEWGKLMQLALEKGYKVHQVALQTMSEQYPIRNISEDFIQSAIDLMVEFWKYGDEIRAWAETRKLT